MSYYTKQACVRKHKPANVYFLYENAKFFYPRPPFLLPQAVRRETPGPHFMRISSWPEQLPVDNRAAEGELISVFEVVPEAEAAGQ